MLPMNSLESSDNALAVLVSVRTCGKPNIQNIMNNVTARPGQTATFKCQVDMSCIVSYIEWYHEMDNGTEKLIKVSLSSPFKRIGIRGHSQMTSGERGRKGGTQIMT